MSTTYTARARLAKPDDHDASWGTPLRADLDALDGFNAVGALAVTTTETPSTTLHVRVTAGDFVAGDGTFTSYAGTGSIAMTASMTNYLYLTDVGVLTVNTTGYPAATQLVRLATVVAGSSTITSITDDRIPINSGGVTTAGAAYLLKGGDSITDAANFVLGTTTGTQLGTGPTQKLGFYGATPVVQGANTSDLRTLLINVGLLATGGANPLNLNGGTLTAYIVNVDYGINFADGTYFNVGSVIGTMIGLTTSQKLGFFGATPIIQPANTTDLRTALINLGFVATGGANPLNLNGGAFTGASLTVTANVAAAAVQTAVRTVTTTATITVNDSLVLGDATTLSFVATLPSAATAGLRITVKKIDASGNTVTVSAAGGQTIEGSSTLTLTAQFDYLTLASSGGSVWYIVGQS